MQDASRLKRALYRAWVRRIGPRIAARARAAGGKRSVKDAVLFGIGHTLVYRALLERLGLRRVRLALSGAAPIAPEVLGFFAAIGVPIVEAWGMSETCGLGTFTAPEDVRLGTVGPPAAGIKVRIDPEDGEIQVAGPTLFRGYWNLADKTAESFLPDGYFLTGDVGEWDDGTRGEWNGSAHMRITDRKKDIIITAGGKNISPSEIENSLKTSPYIREAIVVGDRRKFLAALIGIELDTVGNWALRRGLPYTTYRDLTTKPEVIELIQDEVDRTNEKFARVEGVKKFRLLPKELDHEDGELTATQKVKRAAMAEMFGGLVEDIYGS